ncbi:unnamed protein product [Rotaria sordida]|uniref:F-box domain-containing protein n=1 Tax=Rotaria sordida TaxID=392033 RepID=A0A814ERV7_9BILA|nr:unnamed protein product [Rotaria sordida]
MTISILDLPNEILIDIFCRYVSIKDLCRLKQVCRTFYIKLNNYTLPWKKALTRLTNVSFSQLKNAAGCPSFENIRHDSTILSHPLHLPADYHYEILYDRSNDFPHLLSNDYRPPLNDLNLCSKFDCDINRTINNYYYLISLAYKWNKQNNINNILIKFIRRAQTSLLQYDEHNHQLWFTFDNTLRCLNLHTNHIDYSYGFNYDDILCYKIYNDHLICLANGDLLRIICRRTNEIYSCYNNENLQHILPGERHDILSLDIYSNDKERYLILNGSRDHTVSTYKWNKQNNINNILIKFIRRAQTSLLQYDEHNHQLWFTFDNTLRCLNLHTNHIDYSHRFNHDDILCYKIYNDHLICLANGDLLRIICRRTNEIYSCYNNQNLQHILPGERHDILSLDIYSNDKERYLILNGSRDHTVSMRTFDMSRQFNQLIWRTQVDDRVLCSRFTNDGQYFLIGTGGTSSLYPLILFNIERAQPIHLYNARYRLGAGVRCIEWVSSNVFIAAGFDSQFKEFDIRTGQCHYTFNDEFGNDYCSLAVSVDNNYISNGIILGGNHHSTVRLVNRTQRQLQNVLFVSKQSSPVHSLAVTSEYLFASVDRSIVALDFTGCNRQLQQIHLKF